MFTDQKDHIEWRIQKGDLFFVLTIATVICKKYPFLDINMRLKIRHTLC